MALPTITVDRNRRHYLGEEVRSHFDEPDRPIVEQRTPTGRVALAHVSELVIVYVADFETGGWNWAVRDVRGCLTLADGSISPKEREIRDYLIPGGSWPAWLGEVAAFLHPGTFVSLIEGVSLGRAIKLLSDRTGIPIEGGPRRTPIQRAGDWQNLDFALWWHGRQVSVLSKQLTAYCIHATEQDCEDLGLVLRQLRSLDRQAIIGAARRLATAEDWREWAVDREDAAAVTWACVELLACK